MSKSDGSTADYYELPAGATELQDLISHRNLNAQDGEIFRAIYRKGRASHSDELRDARKVLFYAQAEVKRLEKLAATPGAFGQQNMIDPEDVEISEKQACSVSADEHADMLARFDKRRAELLCRGSCESNVTVLPDGSAFGVMSFPLSRGHWLYADRAYEDGADQPKELPAPILNHGSRDTVVAAARYAVRGATNCGKEPDFDPDALVQNVVYALCGPYGRAEPIPVDPADVDIASAIDDDSERMQAIGQNGNGGEHYDDPWAGAPEWAKHAVMQSDGKWCYYEFRPIRIAADIISR